MFVSLNTWQSIISKTGQKKASEIVDYWRKGRGGAHMKPSLHLSTVSSTSRPGNSWKRIT